MTEEKQNTSSSSEKDTKCNAEVKVKCNENTGMACGIYGMAFLGALVYFIQHATSFWNGVLGVIKAIFWPAVVLYKVLELLGL